MRISDWSSDVCSSDLPGPTQDPAAFESQGIDIAAQDFLVVKSGYHFKLSFDGVATPLIVETPGIARYRPGFFHWQRARVHPAHPVAFGYARALVFARAPQRLLARRHAGAALASCFFEACGALPSGLPRHRKSAVWGK